MRTKRPSNAEFQHYEPPQRLRLIVGILLVVALLWALTNFRQWLVRDAAIDTKGWLAFVSDQAGHDDIWVANASGAISAVTNDEAADESPVWFKNGYRIAFSSTRPIEKVQKEVFQLWSIRPDGTDARGLTVGGGAKLDPHVSRDGRSILHIAQGFITVVDLQDSHSEQLIPSAEHPESLTQWRDLVGDGVAFRKADWSPVNEDIILGQFGSDKDNALFMGVVGGDAPPLPVLIIAASKLDFAWSPVATDFIVAYHNNRPLKNIIANSPEYGFPESGVILFHVTTIGDAKAKGLPILAGMGDKPESLALTVKKVLKTTDAALILEPNYNAEGTQVAYVDATGKNETISRRALAVFASAGLEAGDVTPTLVTQGKVSDPKWSPDGSRLAYLALNGSKRDLWTIDMPGASNARNLTNGKGDNHDINWSPQ